ncbi:putative adhesin [Streptomyces sp. NPDC086023]|uniref:putative adhesin n=1 Tax=Streptomyces sp. NPDC086023 TaxID=3365746 RepID=UPI0037D6FB99
MTDLYLVAHGSSASLPTRARVPRGRSLVTYAAPGDSLSTAEIQLVVSGAASGPEPLVRTADAVPNTQLFPVTDGELSGIRAQFGTSGGELATVPQPMWLCASPTLCSASRHVCRGVLGPAFDAYERIHVLACRGGTKTRNAVAESLARETDAFLAGDYAATRAHWDGLDQLHQARYLAFDGVALWYQVHGCRLRASGAQGEFRLLHDFESFLPKEHRNVLLAYGDAEDWPWATEFMAQVRAEEEALTALERDFDPSAWTGLSAAGQLRALEVYREWGTHYLDSLQDSLTAAGLVVPGHLTPDPGDGTAPDGSGMR